MDARAGGLVAEGDGDMQQADTARVGMDDALSDLAFALDAIQATRGFVELAAELGDVAGIARGAELGLQRIALLVELLHFVFNAGGLRLVFLAQARGVGEELLLPCE